MNQFVLKYFDDLTPTELYDVLQLREEVFNLEQNCLYKDLDDKDRHCWHLLLYQDGKLAAYARLVPEGVSYTGYTSIGRVVSSPVFRRDGLGRQLMQEAVDQTLHLFPGFPLKIGAQAYLQKFYESFGFVLTGDPYIEDGIPHIHMIRG
jgi:ElaA protein